MKAGWEIKRLEDVATLQRGFDLPKRSRVTGIHPLMSSSGRIDTHNVAKVRGPGVVTGRSGSVGAVFYVTDDFWPLNTVLYIKNFHGNHPRYIFQLLNFLEPKRFASGSGVPTLNRNHIHGELVPVPPLTEQEEIVEVLDKAFAAIDQAKANLEQNIANAKELFQSKLNQIFSQKGEGWVETTLEKTLKSQPRNGWSPPAANHSDSGIPVLTLSSVTGFEFRKDKIKHTSIETDSERHYWVNNGELLITRSNTPELVGHVAIAEGIESPTIYPDLIMRMIPEGTLADTRFLYYHLRAPFLREIITGRASGANPTMKKINKSAVQTLPVSLPPLPQQKTIVQHLDTLSAQTRALESHYQTKLTSLEELKKSLLQKAFAGELT